MEYELLVRLGDASLSGTLTVIVAYLICRLFPRLPGAARCWLWWLVCAKLLVGLVLLPTLPLTILPASVASRESTRV